MKANPPKFQVIMFKYCENEEVFTLDIGDELLKLVKLPGVLVDDN